MFKTKLFSSLLAAAFIVTPIATTHLEGAVIFKAIGAKVKKAAKVVKKKIPPWKGAPKSGGFRFDPVTVKTTKFR